MFLRGELDISCAEPVCLCCYRLGHTDLAESQGAVSLEHRRRVQTALLTEVFTTYFR